MRALLDTHTFLWAVSEATLLGRQATAVLTSASSELYLSYVSAWEMVIKHAKGRLRLPQPPLDFIRVEAARNRIHLLAVSWPHLASLHELPLHHGDPFDRMLVAQARAEGLALVSADRQLASYGVPVIW